MTTLPLPLLHAQADAATCPWCAAPALLPHSVLCQTCDAEHDAIRAAAPLPAEDSRGYTFGWKGLLIRMPIHDHLDVEVGIEDAMAAREAFGLPLTAARVLDIVRAELARNGGAAFEQQMADAERDWADEMRGDC